MERFHLEQLLPLTKNEQVYRSLLIRLCDGLPDAQLLQEVEQLRHLCEHFHDELKDQPLDPDPHMTRATLAGGGSNVLVNNCYFYLGEHDVLLERHDRYFPIFLHTHTYLELMCVVHGQCHQVLGSTHGPLRAGDIVCIPPGTHHSFTSFSDDCLIYNLSIRLDDFENRFYNLLQHPSVVSEFLRKSIYAGGADAWLIFHSGDYLQQENLLATIWEVQERDSDLCCPQLNVLTELLFLELLRRCGDHIDLQMNASDNIHQSVLAYIRQRFRTVTLSELSQVFNYSERHISRIIHQATGMTLGEYLQQLRLEHIGQLLAYTNLSIATAFDQAGVKNRSYFYRIFRTHYGMTPAQYRSLAKIGRDS